MALSLSLSLSPKNASEPPAQGQRYHMVRIRASGCDLSVCSSVWLRNGKCESSTEVGTEKSWTPKNFCAKKDIGQTSLTPEGVCVCVCVSFLHGGDDPLA